MLMCAGHHLRFSPLFLRVTPPPPPPPVRGGPLPLGAAGVGRGLGLVAIEEGGGDDQHRPQEENAGRDEQRHVS